MTRRPTGTDSSDPLEIAPGVHLLAVGRGLLRANVYFVRSGPSWTLVDAASANCGRLIREAAESLYGSDSPPTSILLTHDHPDHAGSARELAQMWDCPVWAHPDEMPLALGGVSVFRTYANPLDRWIVLPLLRVMGPKRAESLISRASLRDVVRPFDPGAAPPGLPEWETVFTPGHTPGHVAFFRRNGRVLLTGDALVTVDLNSLRGLLLREPGVYGPPRYATWSRRVAEASIASLAELEPRVIAGGHGLPLTGPETPQRVRAFADQL
jgi:glyoxylase-like metal-dependent hydrolase (beta-lactamase superfamily II)